MSTTTSLNNKTPPTSFNSDTDRDVFQLFRDCVGLFRRLCGDKARVETDSVGDQVALWQARVDISWRWSLLLEWLHPPGLGSHRYAVVTCLSVGCDYNSFMDRRPPRMYVDVGTETCPHRFFVYADENGIDSVGGPLTSPNDAVAALARVLVPSRDGRGVRECVDDTLQCMPHELCSLIADYVVVDVGGRPFVSVE